MVGPGGIEPPSPTVSMYVLTIKAGTSPALLPFYLILLPFGRILESGYSPPLPSCLTLLLHTSHYNVTII